MDRKVKGAVNDTVSNRAALQAKTECGEACARQVENIPSGTPKRRRLGRAKGKMLTECSQTQDTWRPARHQEVRTARRYTLMAPLLRFMAGAARSVHRRCPLAHLYTHQQRDEGYVHHTTLINHLEGPAPRQGVHSPGGPQ